MGYAKRDILVNRVESARDAQVDARGEITDALTEFRKVVDFEGGELEARYKSLAAQLEDSEDAAKQRAGGRLEPALRPLGDQVLHLKHNLNAQATAGIKGEVVQVDALVSALVAETDRATAEADRFIAGLEQGGA